MLNLFQEDELSELDANNRGTISGRTRSLRRFITEGASANSLSHVSRNMGRYALGTAGVGASALAARPVGRIVGKASIDNNDPHYDMNRRAGEATFHSRNRQVSRREEDNLDESMSKVIPVGASVAGAGIIGSQLHSGIQMGRLDKRKSGTNRGYVDAYNRHYGRRESLDTGDLGFTNTDAPNNLFDEDEMQEAMPSALGTSLKWGGRSLAALDLGLLGVTGTKAVMNKKKQNSQNKQMQSQQQSPQQPQNAPQHSPQHSYQTEEDLEERVSGSTIRSAGSVAAKGAGKLDAPLFGLGTLNSAYNKGQDIEDDRKLNMSHVRRKEADLWWDGARGNLLEGPFMQDVKDAHSRDRAYGLNVVKNFQKAPDARTNLGAGYQAGIVGMVRHNNRNNVSHWTGRRKEEIDEDLFAEDNQNERVVRFNARR